MLAVIVFVASLAASAVASPVTGSIIKVRDFPVDPYDLNEVVPSLCHAPCGYTMEAYDGCQANNSYICNMVCSSYGRNQIDICVDCVRQVNQTHPDLIQSGLDAVAAYC